MPKAYNIARTCPKCGPSYRLIVKHRRADARPFLGCPNWNTPRVNCSFTEEMPVEFALRKAGQAMLPGIDE